MKDLNIKGKTEEAFDRILTPYRDTEELTGFQWVRRFFTGKLRPKRISVVCGLPTVAMRDEDNTPLCWDVPVTVEVVQLKKFAEQEAHDDLVATIAEILFQGSVTCADLNTAMAGEKFKALAWSPGDGPEDEIDDQEFKTRITGTLLMTPLTAA